MPRPGQNLPETHATDRYATQHPDLGRVLFFIELFYILDKHYFI